MTAGLCCESTPRVCLQSRDIALLRDLFSHALLTRDQIIALGFFGSIQRANARLGKLLSKGLIARYRDHLLGPQGVYMATVTAAPLIAEALSSDLALIREILRHPISPMMLRHTLQANEVKIAFHRLAKGGAVVEKWLPERRCRHEYTVSKVGGLYARRVFKPDAFVRFRLNGQTSDYFVEVDLGHCSLSKVAQKLQSYADYQSEIYTTTYGTDKFTVLFITTGLERLKNLRRFARSEGYSRCLFSTFADLSGCSSIASPIWFDCEANAPQSLLGGIQ